MERYFVRATEEDAAPSAHALISSTSHHDVSSGPNEKRRLIETGNDSESTVVGSDGPKKRRKRSPGNTVDISLHLNNESKHGILKVEPLELDFWTGKEVRPGPETNK